MSLDPSVSLGLGINPIGNEIIYGTAKVFLMDFSRTKNQGLKLLGVGIILKEKSETSISPLVFYQEC